MINSGLHEEIILDYTDEFTEDMYERMKKLVSDYTTTINIDSITHKLKGITRINNASNIKRIFIYGGIYE